MEKEEAAAVVGVGMRGTEEVGGGVGLVKLVGCESRDREGGGVWAIEEGF